MSNIYILLHIYMTDTQTFVEKVLMIVLFHCVTQKRICTEIHVHLFALKEEIDHVDT